MRVDVGIVLLFGLLFHHYSALATKLIPQMPMTMNECSCDIMHTYDGTLDVFTSEIIFSLNIHCCHEDNLNVEGQATPIIVFFYLYFSSHLMIDDSYTIDDKV